MRCSSGGHEPVSLLSLHCIALNALFALLRVCGLAGRARHFHELISFIDGVRFLSSGIELQAHVSTRWIEAAFATMAILSGTALWLSEAASAKEPIGLGSGSSAQ